MAQWDENRAKVTIDGQDLVLVPSSVSDQRVKQLGLPQQGSEDVSHLLVLPKGLSQRRVEDEKRDYRPEESVEWVIDIEFGGNPILIQTQITQVFDQRWQEANGKPVIFGWSPETNHWTYLISADAPKTFTKLALGWQLFKSYDEDYKVNSADLDRYLKSTEERAGKLGKPLLRTNRTPQEAEQLAGKIREAVANCGRDVIVILKAPRGKQFDGLEIWDTMLCLGLRWGDGDLFHWQNESGVGDDSFFSVWTSTEPGYFLPEEVADGTTHVGDLVFGYSIPRSADPMATLESMVKAVKYAQQRLGGQILSEDGTTLNESDLLMETQEIVSELKQAGFEPGQDSTLHVF